jgi:hypothetical protein
MTPCPHCGLPINPAAMLGKLSAQKRDTSSKAMKALRAKGRGKRLVAK